MSAGAARAAIAAVFFLIATHAASAQQMQALTTGGSESWFIVENRGQVRDVDGRPRPEIRAVVHAGGMRVFVREGGLSFVQIANATDLRDTHDHHHGHDHEEREPPRYERIDVDFVGALAMPRMRLEQPLAWRTSFYVAGNGENAAQMTPHRRLVLENLWPAIDLVLTLTQTGLKYDLHVRDGGRVDDIRLRYSDNVRPQLRADGGLAVRGQLGMLEEEAPVCFLEEGGGRVDGRFVVEGRTVRFAVEAPATQPAGSTLVIDPSLSWSTYVGSSSDDYSGGIDVVQLAGAIMCGSTQGVNFPTTAGVFQPTASTANWDGFVIRFSTAGARVWATYIHGANALNNLQCDAAGNSFMTGCSNSTQFITSAGAFQTTRTGGHDAVIIKMLANGSLGWSTFIGGTSNDLGQGLTYDGAGSVYLTGQTFSNNFPVTTGAYQTTFGGGSDAFVARFDTSGARIWCTYMGGSTSQFGHGCITDPNGFVIVTGETGTGFPTTNGVVQQTFPGGTYSAFLSKFSPAGALIWSTYFGTSTTGYGVCMVGSDPMVVGVTAGTLPGTSGGFQPAKSGGQDAWIARLNSSATSIVWATYLGGSGDDHGTSVRAVNGRLYMTGCTPSSNFPVTAGAYQTTYGGQQDRFLAQFNELGQRCWITFIGGSGLDLCWNIPPASGLGERPEHSIAVTTSGDIYTCGVTPGSFPITTGAFQSSAQGGLDAFMARFWADCTGLVVTDAGRDTTICVGGSVLLGGAGSGNPCGGTLTYSWTPSTGLSATNILQPLATPTATQQYILTITDQNNCTSSDTVTITVSGAVATLTPDTTLICSGGSALLTANTGPGYTYTWYRNGAVISGASAATYTATQTGQYRVRVQTPQGCADTSNVAVVTIGTGPGATITAAGPTSFCPGGQVVLNANTGSQLSYVWKRNNTVIAGATSSSYTATQAGTYMVVVSTLIGCADSTSIVVTIHPTPGATISGAPLTFCQGDGVTLSANTGTGYTYQWRRDGSNLSGATAATYRATLGGSYRVIVTNPQGCSDTSAAVTVVVNPKPGATITPAGPTTVCEPGGVLLNANTGTGYTYVWQRNSTTIGGANGAGYVATQSGGYRVIVTTAQGCSDTSTVVNVTVHPRPGAAITANGPTTFCDPGSVLLTATPATGVTYVWQRNAITISGATAQTLTVTQDGAYRVIATSTNGCIDTSSVIIVTVLTPPIATLTGVPTTLCEGEVATLTASTGAAYAWQRNGALIAGANQQVYGATQSGAYRVIITNGPGCADTSDVVNITVNPKPTAGLTAGGPTTFCNPGSVLLTATPATGVTYAWLLNGSPISGVSAQTYAAAISGTYRVVVTNTFGCSDTSAAITVTVQPRPGATITPAGPITLCQGQGALLSANTGAGFTHVWQRDGANIPGANAPTYNATQPGLYRVIVTSGFGCKDTSATVLVNVNPKPTAGLTAGGPLVFCVPGSVQLTATPAAGVTYVWYMNGSVLPGQTTSTYTTSVSGTFRVIVTNSFGCSDTSAAVTVTAQPRPTATLVASPPTICEGSVSVLTATNGSGYSYTWQRDGVTIGGASGLNYTASQAGSYRVIVTGPGNCSDTSAVVVLAVLPRPDVTIAATGPTVVCDPEQVGLQATASPGTTIQWERNASPIGGATTSTYTASQSGVYRAIVRDGNGCTDTSATITVLVHPRAGAAITPSGPVALCEGSTRTLIATSGPSFQYEWQRDGTTISGATAPTYEVRAPGLYTVIIRTQFGCVDTSTAVDVFVGKLPTQRVEGKTAVCPNTVAPYYVTESAGFTFTWRVDNGTILGGQSTHMIDVRWGTPGTGMVWVTITDNSTGCSRDTMLQVQIASSLRPVIQSNGPSVLCEGDTVLLDAGAGYARYNWLLNNVALGVTTRTLKAFEPGIYTVDVEEANGCSGTSAPFVLSVQAKPRFVLYADGPANVCEGQRVRLRVTVEPPSALTWMRDGREILGATGSEYITAQPGVYRVSGRTGAGCSGESDSIVVVVSPAPRAVATASGPTSFCEGGSVVLRAQPETGMNYVWMRNNLALPGATGVSYTATQTGGYSVIVTDQRTGCSDTSDVVMVTANVIPVARILGTTTYCAGSGTTLTAENPRGSVRWSSGETTTSITVTQPGLYELVVTDTGGCSAKTSALVTELPRPALAIQGSRSICAGGQATLDARAGFAAYQWSTGERTQRITVRAAGIYAVSVTDSAGCSATDTVEVIESDRLLPTISGRTALCDGGSTVLEADSNETYTRFIWTTAADTSTVLGTTRTLVVTTPGRYLVRIADQGGCEGSAIVEVTRASATPTITANRFVCDGRADTLRASTGFVGYEWNTGARTPSIIVTAPGTYTVAVTDSNGCVWNTSVEVRAQEITPTLAGSRTFCTGSSTRLAVVWPGAVAYQWNTGETTRDVVVRTPGIVSVLVTDASGCQATIVDTILESSSLRPSITGARVFCPGTSTELDAGPDLLWQRWSTLDTTVVLSTARQFSVAAAGTYVVRIADSSGCQGIDTLVITTHAPTAARIDGDTQICGGGTATLRATAGLSSYEWSTGERTSDITVAQPGWYWVRIADANGCIDTLRVEVRAVSDLIVTISGRAAFCAGSSDTLDAGAGYTSYRWSTTDTTVVLSTARTFIVTAPGSYVVRVVSAQGCFGRGTLDVVELPVPVPIITRTGDLLESTPAVTWQWMRDGIPIPGATARQYTATQSGRYTVVVTDANGCTGVSAPVDIASQLGSTDIAFVCVPETVHPVGTVVSVPVMLDRITGAPAGSARGYTLFFSTNPSVAWPRGTGSFAGSSGARARYEVRGTRAESLTSGLLVDLPFEVLWGDTACTTVRLDSLRWDDGTATILGQDVCELCAELCYEGGARLFRSDGALSLTVRPNPFNAATVIEFEVIEAGLTDITIHDVMGRRISTLLHEDVAPGRYVLRYDASALASGSYLCVLRTPSQIRTQRMEVLK